ncbi:hypothetical protein EJV47_06345 [Hymenobacter gummosus]|uniref:Uncharacterized protein n=1 Tax=Hymenobacter gummosus TaxID=1776032 RepID=A0A431U509_9BACT|nr:hypothetical protein [Hymenobacter gummosus]RTQ51420.1 hypothetical protein EJV47_06345 [Hymenobacter gummosus]
MRLMLFIATGIACLILLAKLLNVEKNPKIVFSTSFIVACAFAALGAYEGCADGWKSTSIGRRGACSHHGGVRTHVNIYGWSGLAASAFILFVTFSGSGKNE